jgi:hypothetical protein
MSMPWYIPPLARLVWLVGRALPVISDRGILRLVSVIRRLSPSGPGRETLTDLVAALSAGPANLGLLRRAVAGTQLVEIEDLLWGQLAFRPWPLVSSPSLGRGRR